MSDDISFKSFYYSLGTTSFRMQNFNQKIEEQLSLLNDFWSKDEYKNEKWESNEVIQEAYYDFIKESDFLKEGEAPRKAKDARQKTSGMRDIGLITDNRRLTPVGEKLLEISKSGNFSSDNFLQIPKDSYIYFLQLLKTFVSIDKENGVRPFILLSKLLNRFGYLHQYEFVYLFPLCINKETTDFICNKLEEERTKTNVDSIITDIFMQQNNYKEGLKFFIAEKNISEETFCKIGFNRKSKDYDRAYYPLYNVLKKVYFDDDKSAFSIIELYNVSDIKNVKTHWRKLLFKTSLSVAIKKAPLEQLEYTNIFSICDTEEVFKENFYKTMHLIKIKRTLEDYFDLNRRYLKISDTLLFAENQVKFDIIPKYYFSLLPEKFFELAFEKSSDLQNLVPLEKISPYLKLDEVKLLKEINKSNKTNFSKIGDIKDFVVDERLKRFNKLIDEKFTDEKIIEILELFKKRTGPEDDKPIQALVTDEATGPTIFEYILAISWYKLSERKGNIFNFMNLSLEADLLPKTHAGGGESDILWNYPKTEEYPEHNLLIEATLSESTNQRRMELEPVSRHLGDYILSHKKYESYCVFITNYLHINVLADFRNRKNAIYYNSDGSDYVTGMMITPLDTDTLIKILKKKIKYPQLYKIFHEHQEVLSAPKEWYEELQEKI